MTKVDKKLPQWAKNIAFLVEASPHNLRDIAFEAKLTHTHLKNITDGTLTNCRIDTIARLAHVLGCSLSCIYYCKDISTKTANMSSAREKKRYEID